MMVLSNGQTLHTAYIPYSTAVVIIECKIVCMYTYVQKICGHTLVLHILQLLNQ